MHSGPPGRAGALSRDAPAGRINGGSNGCPVDMSNERNELNIQKVSKTRLSDKVVESLVALIDSGQVKQGDRLPTEAELAAKLGVGRSSVREAIHSLVSAGIVDVSPRRGIIVVSPIGSGFSRSIAASIAYWAVRDFYELRILIEGEAAGIAAERAQQRHLRMIEDAHRKVIHRIDSGRSWFDANSQFHLAVARASGNSAFVFCLTGILGGYRNLRESINQLASVPVHDVEDHERVVAAILARDRAAAAAAMRAHLQRTIEKLEAPTSATTDRVDRISLRGL
jgi:GntR family transcriptional regulator, transcriptional repressor for pyruvate dehydrogenase complex